MPTEMLDRVGKGTRVFTQVPDSIDIEKRTVEYALATETPVKRWSWARYKFFEEVLLCTPENVDTRRLESCRTPWLDSHNTRDLDAKVGTITAHRFEGGQLIVEVRYDQTERAEECWARVQRGELPNCSAGYSVSEYNVTEREDAPDTREATLWELFEGSLVTVPADHESAQRGLDSEKEEGTQVRLIGATRTMASTTQKTEKPAAQAPKEPETRSQETTSTEAAETTEPTEEPPTEERTKGGSGDPAPAEKSASTRKAGAASLEYGMRMATACGATAETAQRLYDEELTEKEVSEGLLRNMAKDSGDEISNQIEVGRGKREKVAEGIECALAHRIDERNNKLTDEARPFQGRSLLQLGEMFMDAHGHRTNEMSNYDRSGVLMSGRGMAGGMSTSDFVHLLANVAQKSMLRGYEGIALHHERISRAVPMRDFKPVKRVRMGSAPELKEVGEGGEISVGSMSDTGEQYALGTFARRVALTRHVLVNDDLEVIGRTPLAMGRKAAELENRLVFGILMDNPNMNSDGQPLFHTDFDNVGAGALSEDSLEAALLAMATRTAFDGEEITIEPQFLLCSPKLERVARKLLVIPTSPTNTSEANPYQGRLIPIFVRELMKLGNGLHWFLAADPASADVIELGYMEGHRTPSFETRRGFEVDGWEIKCTHDIVAKAIDRPGLHHMTA